MDENIRTKNDEELSRLYDVLKSCQPTEDNYKKISTEIERLQKLANEDDRLTAESNIAALNRGLESEKQELEEKKLAKQNRWEILRTGATIFTALVGAGVTIFSWIGTWEYNDKAMDKAHDFESDHTYTSKSSQWKVREPIHKNPF